MNIEAMTALYTLTPEQVTKADALLKAYQAQVAPLQAYMMAQRQTQAVFLLDRHRKLQRVKRIKLQRGFRPEQRLVVADAGRVAFPVAGFDDQGFELAAQCFVHERAARAR